LAAPFPLQTKHLFHVSLLQASDIKSVHADSSVIGFDVDLDINSVKKVIGCLLMKGLKWFN
jgi:hypothetical protein